MANITAIKQCLDIFNYTSPGYHVGLSDSLETIWRTLFADRDDDGDLLLGFYCIVVLFLLKLASSL
jgi:hypothetical protein